MLDALDKRLLKTVADLEGLPKGAYNIRKNGKLLQREISANINIEANAEGTGIVVTIKPHTKNESVHIPVILSQAGLFDVVYNSFIIGEGAEVTIVAGCGIHCGSPESEGRFAPCKSFASSSAPPACKLRARFAPSVRS